MYMLYTYMLTYRTCPGAEVSTRKKPSISFPVFLSSWGEKCPLPREDPGPNPGERKVGAFLFPLDLECGIE